MKWRLAMVSGTIMAMALLPACAQQAHPGDTASDSDQAGRKAHPSIFAAMHGSTAPPANASPSVAAAGATKSLQGDASWRSDPHMKRFYDLSVAMLAPGKAVDRALYEAKSREIFEAFAASRGMDTPAMQDHLKAIPGQMIQIAREDPNVLKSQAAFITALFGPE